jgi:hypothetical protein
MNPPTPALRIYLSFVPNNPNSRVMAIRLHTLLNVHGGQAYMPSREGYFDGPLPQHVAYETSKRIKACNLFLVFLPDYKMPPLIKAELAGAGLHIPAHRLLVVHLVPPPPHGHKQPGFSRIYADPAQPLSVQMQAITEAVEQILLPDRSLKRLYALLLVGLGIVTLQENVSR